MHVGSHCTQVSARGCGILFGEGQPDDVVIRRSEIGVARYGTIEDIANVARACAVYRGKVIQNVSELIQGLGVGRIFGGCLTSNREHAAHTPHGNARLPEKRIGLIDDNMKRIEQDQQTIASRQPTIELLCTQRVRAVSRVDR